MLPQTSPDVALSFPSALSEIDALYTTLPEAVEELERRRRNSDLCARVGSCQQSLFPTFIPPEPFGLLFRSIITPNHEFDRFLSFLCRTKLRPILGEFHHDFFITNNRDKYRLGLQAFTLGPDEARGLRVVDLQSLEGGNPTRISDLTTKTGLKLTDYHHALLEHGHPGCEKHLVDLSAWFLESRCGEFYYLRYLSLFICHGILFENFIASDKSEVRFVLEKVVPSFKKATEFFGVRPLIVRLLPHETENDDYWRSLPSSLYSPALHLLGCA